MGEEQRDTRHGTNMVKTAISEAEQTFCQMVELLIYLRNSKRVDSVAELTIKAVTLVMRVTQRSRKQAHGLLCNLRRGRHAGLAKRILAAKPPTKQTYMLTRTSCIELLKLLPNWQAATGTMDDIDRMLDELFAAS
jgi:hypothetical protein